MMRYNNQLTVEKLMNCNLSKMSAVENCDNSSSDMETVVETNNNNSTMSDNFSWIISKPDLGLSKITKSFAVLCESESNENAREFKQAPTSR